MIYLVLTEFISEALDLGEGLSNDGKPELVAGIVLGVGLMILLALF